MTLLSSSLRNDYPALAVASACGKPLVYLDSAATALRPRLVIEAVSDALGRYSSGVHRSVHYLGDEATERFERARRNVARWIGAQEHEIVFTRNSTESLNFVARGWPRTGKALVSASEHHSCLLPWGKENVDAVPPLKDGTPDVKTLLRKIGAGNVSVVAVSQVSNVSGYHWDIPALAKIVHAAGAILVVDAAQSAPHGPLDVQALGCDFLAFSGHKLGSPGGVGVLYGRAELMERLSPAWRGGGSVEHVHDLDSQPRAAPWRFESGTPALEAVIGLDAAIDYLWTIGPDDISAHLAALRRIAVARLQQRKGVKILGVTAPGAGGPVSFMIEGQSPHFLARALSDAHGVCVRSGFHCAQPLHDHMGFPASMRLSFYVYNQPEELDVFFDGLDEILSASPR
jgi:cysteine desulfurase/selenocysteine lyase